ncbi:hypothetical protein F511_17806 [Dorcoceras hygrometricum]|uniref:Uncharacterized protein n=1 Tax=Dorcoceras hygrometricum TaxID=472368 RepID=A0A2Z7AW03_9LAMI|nr:hypothetical protein F511_17806 [Dorcoceras hygrometricum]
MLSCQMSRGDIFSSVVSAMSDPFRCLEESGCCVSAKALGDIWSGSVLIEFRCRGSSDESESGSVRLLLLRCFVSYLFRRLWRSWKRIAKTSPLCSLLVFHPSLLGSDLVVVLSCDVSVAYQDARASGDTALSSPCWVQLATMTRVGFPGFYAGRGFDPAGGAPGGG